MRAKNSSNSTAVKVVIASTATALRHPTHQTIPASIPAIFVAYEVKAKCLKAAGKPVAGIWSSLAIGRLVLVPA